MDIHASIFLKQEHVWKKYELQNLLKPAGLLLSKSSNKKCNHERWNRNFQIVSAYVSKHLSLLYSSAAVKGNTNICNTLSSEGASVSQVTLSFVCLSTVEFTSSCSAVWRCAVPLHLPSWASARTWAAPKSRGVHAPLLA